MIVEQKMVGSDRRARRDFLPKTSDGSAIRPYQNV
jgi:hypothetical protein